MMRHKHIIDQSPHSCVTIFVACIYMLVEIVNQTIENRARKLLEEENWVEAGSAGSSSSGSRQAQVPRPQAAPSTSSLASKSSRTETPERPYESAFELT